MWRCVNCSEEVEDKFTFCWKCGTRDVVKPLTKEEQEKQRTHGTPRFGSIEEISSKKFYVPETKWEHNFLGGMAEIVLRVIVVVIAPAIGSQIKYPYGLYIGIGIGVIVLASLLWKLFRPHPLDNVGIKLGK